MQKVKFMHLADTHLRDAAMGSSSRGPDFTFAFNSAVDIAVEQGIEHILHCGDILNVARPSALNFKDMLSIHLRLQKHGICMHTITGNHDFCRPHWIESLPTAPAGQTGGILLVDNKTFMIGHGKNSLKVVALPTLSEDEFLARAADIEGGDILMWHGPIREFKPVIQHALSVEQLPVSKFKAILLGDIHAWKYLRMPNGCLIGYPGATELVNRNDPLEYYTAVFEVDPKAKEFPEPQKMPIKLARKHLARRIMTSEDMDRVLKELKKLTEPTLMLVAYNPAVEAVDDRLRLAAGDNVMLRTQPLFSGQPMGAIAWPSMADADAAVSRTPASFVSHFVPVGSIESQVLTQLCDEEAAHGQIINDYFAGLEAELASL